MHNYLLRIYDDKVKTNYIERLIKGSNRLEIMDKVIEDNDIKREASLKLSSKLSLEELIDNRMYTIEQI